MKKILKIAGVFVVLLGLILGFQQIKSHQSDDSDDIEINSSASRNLSDQIKNDWTGLTGWSREQFEKDTSKVSAKFAGGNINRKQKQELLITICSFAINNIDTVMREEWKKPNCSVAVINKQYQGLEEIRKLGCMNNDPRVTLLVSVYETYQGVLSLANAAGHSTFGAKPAVSYGPTWKNFKEVENSLLARATGYKGNQNYRTYLSNITQFQNIESKIRANVHNAADNYYRGIVNALNDYYVVHAADSCIQDKDIIASRLCAECQTTYQSTSWRNLHGYN